MARSLKSTVEDLLLLLWRKKGRGVLETLEDGTQWKDGRANAIFEENLTANESWMIQLKRTHGSKPQFEAYVKGQHFIFYICFD
jgi:hypothetical protein